MRSFLVLCVFVLSALLPQYTSATTIPFAITPTVYSHPSKLLIPKLALASKVKAMGLTADNKMAVPDNYTEVGWYANTGVSPGSIGNAVIGAHVDNGSFKPTTKGVFKNLHALVPGDDIFVTDASGKLLHFRVTTTKIVPYNSKETTDIFGPTNERHLNLITCYGSWMPTVGTYSQRLVVFAKLV